MSELWYVLIVLALITIGGALLWWRRTRTADRIKARDAASPPLSRNYTDERETTRTSGLSTEEQAWETDRLRRNQEAKQPPGADEGRVPPEPFSAQARREGSGQEGDPEHDPR